MRRSPTVMASVLLVSCGVALQVGACGSDDLSFPGSPTSSGSGTGAGGAGAEGGAGSGASSSSAAQSGGSTASSASQGGAGAAGGGERGGAGPGGAGPGGAGGGPACDPIGGECAACLHDTCNDSFCGCAGEPECIGLLFCLQLCQPNDKPCHKECYSENPSGISDAALLGDCGASNCQQDCSFTLELDDCESCLYSSCSTQMNTCVANPECYELLVCVSQCAPGDSVCNSVCAGAHPFGLGDAGAVQQCSDMSCAVCN